MPRYQSWKICPDTRAGRYARIPELEDMSRYQRWKICSDITAGRYARIPELEDMSRYQRWKICPDKTAGRYGRIPELEDMFGCPDTRATARGPELQRTLPVESPFLPESLLYHYHRQRIEGPLSKDYTVIAECCQWFLRQCPQNPFLTALMIYS